MEDDQQPGLQREVPKLYLSSDLPIHPDVLVTYNLPQYEQRTPEWYEAREQCITASSMAAALPQIPEVYEYYLECFPQADFKAKPDKSCAFKDTELDLIMNKCGLGDGFKGNEFTAWGQKYEDVVSNIYAQMHQTDIISFGLLRHPKYPFVGASPDGIVARPLADGTIPMLEIKCPPSRSCKDHPPIYYFIQTLIQMECVDQEAISVTDYFDANFVEYVDVMGWEADAEKWEAENAEARHHLFGIVLSYDSLDDDGEDVIKHLYAPPSVRTKEEFLLWADTKEAENLDTQFQRTHYKLHKHYISRVKRSHEWFMRNLPLIEKVWNKILHGRTPEGKEELRRIKEEKETAKDNRRQRKIAQETINDAATSDIAWEGDTGPAECLL